jgi:hypothetical protein
MVVNALAAVLALVFAAEPPSDEMRISPDGRQLLQVLDRADVAHRWLAGVHVDWRSGEPDGKVERHPDHATHCSAFVASIAEQLNVPLLRPPEHPDHQLANAQFDWLTSEAGRSKGWVPVAAPLEAQQRANRGEWVLAVYRATKDGHHGHIAVVRPAEKTAAQLDAEGPQVTQAGTHNYQSATLAAGFDQHPGAWGTVRAVRFFAHALSLPAK